MKNLFFKNYCRKLLIFLALSIVVVTLIFSLCACDDDGADELPIEIVSSNYEFSVDLSSEGKTEFYFTPKFSGDYVVTIDDENATFLIDGVEISERIVYFSKKEKYDIVFLSSQKSIKGSIAPQQVVETTMHVRRENDFVVKYVPKKSGKYLIDLFDEEYYSGGYKSEITGITVYDKNFDKLDELESRTYFFQQDEKERCYYIVISNLHKYLDISLDLTIGEVYPNVFIFQNYSSPYSFSIRGKAGDIIYVYVTSFQKRDVKDKLYIGGADLGKDIQMKVLNRNSKNDFISSIETDGKYQVLEFPCKGGFRDSLELYWRCARLKIEYVYDFYYSISIFQQE